MNLNYVDREVYDEFRRILDLEKLPSERFSSETLRVLRHLRMADSRVSQKRAAETSEKLKEALKEIRKELNIYARIAFSCCGSCGSYELANKCKETGKKGYLFYSRQSKDDLEKNGRVYFNYSVSDDDNDGTRKLGMKIVKVFKKHHINVEWDGSPDTCILVKA